MHHIKLHKYMKINGMIIFSIIFRIANQAEIHHFDLSDPIAPMVDQIGLSTLNTYCTSNNWNIHIIYIYIYI